jgi:hypothetical protein
MLHQNVLDFEILPGNCNVINILDTSSYLGKPDRPSVFIQAPGFNEAVQILIKPNTVNVINSQLLNQNCQIDIEENSALSDGLYWITLGICPYENMKVVKPYLRTCLFECQLDQLLVNDRYITDLNFQNRVSEVEILLNAAHAHVRQGSTRGMALFQKAKERFDHIINFEFCSNG